MPAEVAALPAPGVLAIPPSRLSRNRLWLEIIILAVISVLTYANTLHDSGFVTDSNFVISQDERVHRTSLENLGLIFSQDYWQVTGGESGLYRPLTTLSFLFNYAILGNGGHATGYHLLNVLVHTANVILVYLMIGALPGAGGLALFAAAIFAVHPVNVEAVTNLVGRADLLAACSVLTSFLCYVKAAGSWGRQKILWLLAMMFAVTLGLFCKETAVVILLVVVLYDGTFRLLARHRNVLINLCLNYWQFFRQGYVALIPPLLIFFGARRLVFSGLDFAEVQFVLFVDNPLLDAGFWAARLTAIKVVGRYLGIMLWPYHLASDYSYNQIPVVRWPFQGWEEWQALVALIAIVALVWLGVKQRRSEKAFFFFLFFFFGALLPTANLLPRPGEPLFEPESWLIGSIMAERFLYLPSIGFAGCLVIAVTALAEYGAKIGVKNATHRPRAVNLASVILLSVLVVGFALRSFLRNFDWESEFSLWSKDVQTVPNNVKAHLALAMLAATDARGNNLERAISEAEKAMAISDRYLPVLLKLGIYYRLQGEAQEVRSAADGWTVTPQGKPWFEKSVAVLQRAALLDKRLNEERRVRLLKAGRDPQLVGDNGELELYENLGVSQVRLGNTQEALAAYRTLRHLAPFELRAYQEIAKIFQASNDFKEAAISLHQVRLLGNKDPEIDKALIDLYGHIDPQGCALDKGQSQAALDMACPLVQQQVCQANFGLVEVLLQAKQFDAAWQMVQSGLRDSKCPQKLYEPLMPRQ